LYPVSSKESLYNLWFPWRWNSCFSCSKGLDEYLNAFAIPQIMISCIIAVINYTHHA